MGGLSVVIVAVVSMGCGSLDIRQPSGVTIYGRAGPIDEGWFGLVPPGDPPEVVGFGSDGVGCLDGPAGAQVAWYDGSPSDGGKPKQIIGRVPGDGGPLVLWVEIADDGTLDFGPGVPAWWAGDPQVC